MSPIGLWKYGVPFLVFIIGGSFGLREFTELRFRYKDVHSGGKIRDEIKKSGLEMQDPSTITLEKEYEKLQKEDIDNWENIRIKRPWPE